MAKNKEDSNPGAIFVPAGIIGGMGVGIALGNTAAGLFIGMGIGFALMAITMLATKQNK